MTNAYALSGRITIYAPQHVVDAADRALRFVIDLALGPTRSADELRKMMDQESANVIADFARACRMELERLG